MITAQTIDSHEPGRALSRTMGVLLAWLFVALALGLAGAFAAANGGPPLALGAAITAPLVLYWLDGRRGHPVFEGIARLDPPVLALLQTFRVMGAVFLVAWWRGALPGGFALPAGIGDVLVGLAAPFVAAALANRRPYARRLFVAWNVLGVVDLVTAVTLGVAHSRTPFGFLAGSVSTDLVARYPFSLIPTFFVPLALILHGVSLAKSRTIR